MVKKLLIVAVIVMVTCVCVSNGSPVIEMTTTTPSVYEEDDDDEGKSSESATDVFTVAGSTKSSTDTTTKTYDDSSLTDSDTVSDRSTEYPPYAEDVGGGRSFWTAWFNTDSPNHGTGDLESASFVSDRMSMSICPRGSEIVAGDCRKAETHEGPPFLDDKLLHPCGKYGLLCLNEHQRGRNCSDFEVRFKCQVIEDSGLPILPGRDRSKKFYSFDVRIYIILAVIPISIFILRICWTFTWDHRHRRFVRRNSEAVRRPSVVSVNSELFRPPPNYCELFGEDGSAYVLSRNYKLCELCSSSRCALFSNSVSDVTSTRSYPIYQNASVTGNGPTGNDLSDNSTNNPRENVNNQNSAERTELIIKSVPTNGGSGNVGRHSHYVNMLANDSAFRDSDSSSVSVDDVTTTRDNNSGPNRTTERDLDSISVSNTGNEITNNTNHTNPDRAGVGLRDGHSNERLVDHSDNSVPDVPESGGDVYVASEQCTCPCHNSTPHEPNYDNLAFVSDHETNNGTARRLPGMHVSVFDAWSTEPPPPSYREALQLLKQNISVHC